MRSRPYYNFMAMPSIHSCHQEIWYRGKCVIRISENDIESEPLEWTYARIAVQCHIRDKVLEVEEWLAKRREQISWE